MSQLTVDENAALEALLSDERKRVEAFEGELFSQRLALAKLEMRVKIFGDDELTIPEKSQLDTLKTNIARLEGQLTESKIRVEKIRTHIQAVSPT